MNRLSGLVELEAAIMEQSRISLELRNPNYCQAFLGALRRGSDDPMAAASPHLGEPPWWYELLGAVVAVELAMDHVRHSLALIGSQRGATSYEGGRLLSYHMDNWIIMSTALLEKADHLVCRVYRTLVKRVDPEFNGKLEVARAPFEQLRTSYGNLRNSLVHPLEGAERAIAEERLWESQVLIGGNVGTVLRSYYEGLPERRDSWHAKNTQRSMVVMVTIDQAFARAVEHMAGRP